jgi:hypothetical protein
MQKLHGVAVNALPVTADAEKRREHSIAKRHARIIRQMACNCQLIICWIDDCSKGDWQSPVKNGLALDGFITQKMRT